jgi:hypothetical protein
VFLALGAILVPANVAAAYFVYFEDGPIPGAVFWLLGALISGGFHTALALRLASRAYGVLAVLAVPVAACSLIWLIVPDEAWFGPAAAAGLVAALAVARQRPPIPLVQAIRATASGLLPLAGLVSLISIDDRTWGPIAPAVGLLLTSAGLAWEAARRGRTWWVGAVTALLMTVPIAFVLAEQDDRPFFVSAVVLSGLIAAMTARRLPARQALLWDVAAIGPALIYPVAAWGDDRACLELLAGLALVTVLVAGGRRSSLPLYAGVLAVDGTFVKLLSIYGSPDSPTWALGAALWPLGFTWAVLGAALPRRISGPAWAGALVTLTAATVVAWEQPTWSSLITATGAVATVVAAWRLGFSTVLLLAGPWLLLAGYQAANALGLPLPWRFVVTGATSWLLIAISLLRPVTAATSTSPGRRDAVGAAASASPAASTSTEKPATEPSAEPAVPSGSFSADQAEPTSRPSGGGLVEQARLPIDVASVLDWPLAARLGAVAVAGFAALMLLPGLGRGDDWLVAATVAWLDLALVLAAWAALSRSRDLAVVTALSVVPALLTGIARLHPADGQAYALPVGLYLLGVAAVTRLDRRSGRPWAASAIAAFGLLALLGTGVVQSLDENRFGHALLTLAESLVLVGVGIAVRWRVLVVGGVAGTVIIALRQLFDAVAALPGWAILGGSGILLLGTAVALLLARARLVAAGRSVAERWSNWD